MTKVLLLGIGRWGANHLRILHSLPIDFFVTDLDPKRLDAARKLGVADDHLSTDYRSFADRVDAAVIVTPAQTHFAITREFLLAAKDVFVEKPLTLVAEESRQLAELAQKRGRILQVGHIFRFDPATHWLRSAIKEGQFGRVQMLRGHFGGFKRPRNDSGVTFADAIHFVDLFNHLLDQTPRRVHAVLHDFMGRGMDDASFLSLEYAGPHSPIWATVNTDYFIPGKFREVVVIGDRMSAVCDYNVAQYKIKTFENRHVREGADFKAVEGALRQIECPPEEPLLAELRGFLDCVTHRKAPLADGWAGYESIRVLEAAMASAKSGSTVTLEPDQCGGR